MEPASASAPSLQCSPHLKTADITLVFTIHADFLIRTMDQGPFPPEPPLPRGNVRGACRHCVQYDHSFCRHAPDLPQINLEFLCDDEGLSDVPHIYRRLFQRTKVFTATVQDLVNITIKCNPAGWGEAARSIVDYSVFILRSERLGFERFLHSQRGSIYWMLDDALLRICLDRWENRQAGSPWDQAIAPILLTLADAKSRLPSWVELDVQNMAKHQIDNRAAAKSLTKSYFDQTQCFLQHSSRLYEIWRTVRMSGIGKLPAELADAIIGDVMSAETLPKGDLRPLYLPKG